MGGLALSSLVAHWYDDNGRRLTPCVSDTDSDVRRDFFSRGAIVFATADITKPAAGKIVVAAPALTFRSPSDDHEETLSNGSVPSALDLVPVELSVELGHAALSMRDVAALTPGSFIELSSTVETPLPILCGGIVKAFGRPVLSNGTVAVEVLTLGGGTHD